MEKAARAVTLSAIRYLGSPTAMTIDRIPPCVAQIACNGALGEVNRPCLETYLLRGAPCLTSDAIAPMIRSPFAGLGWYKPRFFAQLRNRRRRIRRFFDTCDVKLLRRDIRHLPIWYREPT